MSQPNECSVGAFRPTGAERVRTLLVAADSLTITTDKHRCSLVGLHAIDAVGRLILRAPAHSCLVTEVVTGPGKGVPTMVEVTDVAAVAVRDRIRARVTVHGSLSLSGASLVHRGPCSGTAGEGAGAIAELSVEMAAAELEEAAPNGGPPVTAVVDPAAFAAVDADPLCLAESDMLIHLATAHPSSVALLARLIEPRLLQSVVAVVPWAIDRYGITLRLERAASAHRDVRVPFGERSTGVPHAQRQLNALLTAAAQARPCGHTR